MARFTVFVPCRVEVAIDCPIATSAAEAINHALRHFRPDMLKLADNAEFIEMMRSWCVVKENSASGGARFTSANLHRVEPPKLTPAAVPEPALIGERDWR